MRLKRLYLHIYIIRFIIRFFNAVKSIKSDWGSPESSILSLGLGVGALINIMQILFVKMFVEEFNMDAIKTIKQSETYLANKLKGIEKINFSKDGPYGRSSGASTISNIKEGLISNIYYFEYDDYQTFKNEFTRKNGVHAKFKTWLKNND